MELTKETCAKTPSEGVTQTSQRSLTRSQARAAGNAPPPPAPPAAGAPPASAYSATYSAKLAMGSVAPFSCTRTPRRPSTPAMSTARLQSSAAVSPSSASMPKRGRSGKKVMQVKLSPT